MQNQQERQKLQVWKTLFRSVQLKGWAWGEQGELRVEGKIIFRFHFASAGDGEERTERKTLSKKIDRESTVCTRVHASRIPGGAGNAGPGLT